MRKKFNKHPCLSPDGSGSQRWAMVLGCNICSCFPAPLAEGFLGLFGLFQPPFPVVNGTLMGETVSDFWEGLVIIERGGGEPNILLIFTMGKWSYLTVAYFFNWVEITNKVSVGRKFACFQDLGVKEGAGQCGICLFSCFSQGVCCLKVLRLMFGG